MTIDLYAEHAKEKGNLPPDWEAFNYECFPKIGATLYFEITGAVCKVRIKTGKRKGGPNYDKMDRSTRRTITIPVSEHDAWKTNWEKKNGKCHECTGTGKVFASWSVKDGVKNRTCPRCNGSKTGP